MDKKILFIAPIFFGYYKEIIKELENQNYQVDYFCDAPSNSNISKAVGRVNKNFLKCSMNKYFRNNVLKKIENQKYEYVFVIAGMTFSFYPEMIARIKELNEDAKFILYQWDGEKNISFVQNIHKYFENIYTFDRIDYENNERYKFLPLFYTSNYEFVGNKKVNNFKYDVSYIGTAHPQKLKMINEMSKKLECVYSNQYIYHYMPSRLKYYYHKIFAKEYKKVKLKDLNLEKVSSDEAMRIFEESKCILDAPQKGQNGLTIRTIECLGAKRKLITINKDIKNYDFYNEKNILIYDENIDFNSEFFLSEYEELPKDIYEKYSLRNWLKEIINN